MLNVYKINSSTYVTGTTERVGVSHKVFNFNCLFKQFTTEWAFPRKHTSEVLGKIKNFIDKNCHIKVRYRLLLFKSF